VLGLAALRPSVIGELSAFGKEGKLTLRREDAKRNEKAGKELRCSMNGFF
jgi:hypothetical protein